MRRAAAVRTPASRRPRPTVVVLGAGIAGLTAAHELVERGFDVTVYEPRADERAEHSGAAAGSHPPVKLGGLAASQYAAASGGGPRLRPFPGRQGTPRPPLKAVAGEHGFRLFPAYYLHIWDLLARIPIYEPEPGPTPAATTWRPTCRTVMDNVRRVVVQATTVDGKPTLIFPREAPRTLAELLTAATQFSEFGFAPTDVQTFAARLLRFLVTHPLRRAAELANVSAYDFFTGRDGGGQRFRYTPRFEAFILDMPKVLAAFDSRWGDARTTLGTYLQLQLQMSRSDNKADGVLNGPTTESWFDHWYRHLARLGVRFIRGAAVVLEAPPIDPGRPAHLRPRATAAMADGTRLTPDYIVAAVDAPTAERITAPLRAAGTGGTVVGLDGFTTSVAPPDGPLQPEATRPPRRRDPFSISQTGTVPWDRFQTLAGVQFYFDTQFQLARGHMYHSGTEWRLSSINQHAQWENKPALSQHGYVSVLSVDIGDFNAPSRHLLDAHGRGKVARDCTADEIAAEVWRQIASALTSEVDHPPEAVLPVPVWYALDRNLVLTGAGDGDDRPVRNEAPYLVPIVGDWSNRPDGEPWNPNGTSWITRPTEEQWLDDLNRRHVWQARHGGYPVHHNSLVFAGTWTRTFTRMTSMEAACESGRHAVNAILDHYVWVETGGADPRERQTIHWRYPFGFLDEGTTGPVRHPSPAGDYCFVFDIENREPLDTRPLRNLDSWYFLASLPHPFDTMSSGTGFGTDPPTVGGARMPTSSDDYTGQLLSYLQAWRQYLERAVQQAATATPSTPPWPPPVPPMPSPPPPVPPMPSPPGYSAPPPAAPVGASTPWPADPTEAVPTDPPSVPTSGPQPGSAFRPSGVEPAAGASTPPSSLYRVTVSAAEDVPGQPPDPLTPVPATARPRRRYTEHVAPETDYGAR